MGRPLRHSEGRVAELEEMEREMQRFAAHRRLNHDGQTPGHSPPGKVALGDFSASKAAVTGMGGVLKRAPLSQRWRRQASCRYNLPKIPPPSRSRVELEEADRAIDKEEAEYHAFKRKNFV